MTEERLAAGDNRASFMWCHVGDKPHLLCLWQICDEHDILNHVVTKLDPKVATSGENVAADTSDAQKK